MQNAIYVTYVTHSLFDVPAMYNIAPSNNDITAITGSPYLDQLTGV